MAEAPSFTGEVRMLIDGKLVDADSGKRFDNINPATEEVLGAGRRRVRRPTCSRPSPPPAGRSTRPTGRRTTRCASAASSSCRRRSRPSGRSCARSSSPRSARPACVTYTAQLDAPLDDGLRYPAKLIDEFAWERDLPDGAAVRHRTADAQVWKEPMGVVGAIVPWNYPVRGHDQQDRPDPRHRQHDRAQAGARHAVERHPARPPRRREDRHPAGRVQRRHVVRPPRRRGAHAVAAGRHDLLHRLDRHRQADHGEGRGHAEAGLPRARRQVGDDRARRRRLRRRWCPAASMVCMHAGQGCAMQTRMLLPRSRYDEGVELITQAMGMVPYGDPHDPNVIMGPLISAKQRDRVLGYIAKGQEEGRQARARRRPAGPPARRAGTSSRRCSSTSTTR